MLSPGNRTILLQNTKVDLPDEGWPQPVLECPVVLDEELILKDDVEGALELLVAGLPGPDETQHAVQDVGVRVGELLQGPRERGLRSYPHLANNPHQNPYKSSQHCIPCCSDLLRG